MKVLVTGGSGWIGRATIAALEAAGHEARAFDRTAGDDVLNELDVAEGVGEVDHVIHLAGMLGTHELFSHPRPAVRVNVIGTMNVVLECAERGRGLTMITMPRVNPSLYAATKAAGMDIAEAYRVADLLKVSYVRAYNAYGPGQAYGGDHPQKIVPTFASKAWRGESIPVWGDGSLLTDLVHVDDVARMLVAAMDFGEGQVFDAGTGYAQPVLAVAEKVHGIVHDAGGPHEGTEPAIRHLPPRAGERTVSTDADFAQGEGWELLEGWRPVFDPQRFRQAVLSYRPAPGSPGSPEHTTYLDVLAR